GPARKDDGSICWGGKVSGILLKYKDLKSLQTGVSTEDEEPRAASWKWCHGLVPPSLHLPLRDPLSLHLPLLPQIVKRSAATSSGTKAQSPLVNSSE
ncbi:hypothetical protein F2P79_014602, partial [Pimephales promelas]